MDERNDRDHWRGNGDLMATSIVNPIQSFSTPAAAPVSPAKAKDSLTNEDAFLKLLVSQLQHQDPLNPADGVQFLTQLTGFSQLEQLIQINQQLGQRAENTATSTAAKTTTQDQTTQAQEI
jgi:flagellar hook assembly protein FlgD